MNDSTLVVEKLTVEIGVGDRRRRVVQDISFTLAPGKVVALVGESGSGKSVTARALVGLVAEQSRVTARRFNYGAHDLRQIKQKQWRALRGKSVGFVLQDALVSLDPLRTIGDEVIEALRAHGWGNKAARQQRMLALLAQVGLPDPERIAQLRAGELSGGLRQRALIATALALDPPILIADEPTTALDTTVQAQIIALLATLRQQGRGLLLISHDLALVSRLADEIIVLHHGVVVEQGATRQILSAPRHDYTRALLNAAPGSHPRTVRTDEPPAAPLSPPVLAARNLGKTFHRAAHRHTAVHDVSFTLPPGQTLGIIGESGCGKTTTARLVMGLLTPDEGEVTFNGEPWVRAAPQEAISERQRREKRRQLSIIYQDPLSSFDPRWSVAQILSDALDAAAIPRTQHPERIAALLARVRLTSDYAGRWPHQLSGGQRQRIAIARAIATEPQVIICDEPVSALDVSVQAQVLDLLADLQDELGVSYLFISHDLGVIRHICHHVLVMQQGRVVEQGAPEQLFHAPQHPFTQKLIQAAL
ncbi:peptide/nickel transport system ATP-binding protein [Paramixta manurensis]|uniref:Peptide/nickel transport system ATP-binding protein n=1 Tax=Paramixta manurensis TaxID=2740817 RepID=A0A6M8U8D2_9GAMM|nr:peptide/nickel transport system ATP-binding protein [Erwiniaceae bacterium PD-1]